LKTTKGSNIRLSAEALKVLKALAKNHRRSMTQELTFLLELQRTNKKRETTK